MTTKKQKYPFGWYSIIAKKLNMNRGKVRYQLINNTECPEVAQELGALLLKKQSLDKLKEKFKLN